VLLDEDIEEARALRGTTAKIFSSSGREEPFAGRRQDSHWDHSFLRAERTGDNDHGSGSAALLMVAVVALRFVAPAVYRRASGLGTRTGNIE
jgi:hypothetical protein